MVMYDIENFYIVAALEVACVGITITRIYGTQQLDNSWNALKMWEAKCTG